MNAEGSNAAAGVWLYSHPQCLQHQPGAGHPESPQRLQVVLSALHGRFGSQLPIHQPQAARLELLRQTHHPRLVEQIQQLRPTGGVALIDGDTLISAGSWEAALLAAGAGVDAVDAILDGRCRRAFCAVRPPGHHATPTQAMGFCLFNNIAVAARHARNRGIERIAIADFDVHHGNGTQDIFWSDPSVSYFSSHQSPLYPGTGDPHETGRGNIHNAVLKSGSGSIEFRAAWSQELLPAMRALAPQWVMISAGFDAHYLDPLAGLAVTTEDFHWLTGELCRIADDSADGRVISMLEGGYSLSALSACAVTHVEALMEST